MTRIPFEDLGDVPEEEEARAELVARLREHFGWEDRTEEEVLAAYREGRARFAARVEVLEARAAKRRAKVSRLAARAEKREKRERERRRRPVHRR